MNKKNYVPDWKLQRYLIDELPKGELEAIRAQSMNDGELRSRIDALAACHADIRTKYPPEWMARKVRLLAESRSKRASSSAEARGFPLLRVALPALACAALAISIPKYMPPADAARGGFDETMVYEERAKGEEFDAPVIQVWRKTGNTPERLAPGATARDGDVVQLWYAVSAQCYGTIVSVDGRGALTVHLSGNGGIAAELTPGRPVSLPAAYKLDDAPMYETFYLITSPNKFDIGPLKNMILDAKHPIDDALSPPLPQIQITAFTLRKISESEI